MGFNALSLSPGSRKEPVLVSVRHIHGRPRLRLTFHPDFIRQVGWQAQTQLLVLVGDGPDAGLVMLKPAPTRGFRMRRVSNSVRLALECSPPQGAPEKWASAEPEMRADTIGKALTIRLPWTQKLRAVG